MRKRCRFCGEPIQADVNECEHCGKTLRPKDAAPVDRGGLTNLKSWKQTTVPTWVMFLAVAAALFCVWLMFARGCN